MRHQPITDLAPNLNRLREPVRQYRVDPHAQIGGTEHEFRLPRGGLGQAAVRLQGPGFNSSVFWWAGMIVAFVFFLHYSPKGSWVFALGGDQESARNAGIPVRGLNIWLFVLCSTCAAFAEVLQVMTFSSATSQANFGLIFNTIISVVVGGVLLTGGFCTVMGHRLRCADPVDRDARHRLYRDRPEPVLPHHRGDAADRGPNE